MGFLLIFGAVILNLVKAYSSKKLSKTTDCLVDNINLSVLRNLFCAILGAVFIFIFAGADFSMPWQGFLICVLAGAITSVNYIAWVMALKTDAIVFASTANNANFIVVGICGVLFFGEQVTVAQGLAVLFILLACVFMVKYQKGVGDAPRMRDAMLLLTVFLAGGLTSVTEKCFARYVPTVSSHLYTFYTFSFSILILLCVRIFVSHPQEVTVEQKRAKIKIFLPYAAVMGVAIYGVTYFKTLANSFLDTIVLYPLNNGLTLVASALMAWACFGEKPNKNSIIGMILIFLALLLSSGTMMDIIAKVL